MRETSRATVVDLLKSQLFSTGAGQDVGRSCILLQMGGKNIMLDCGMHMGYNDEVIYNPFSNVEPSQLLIKAIILP